MPDLRFEPVEADTVARDWQHVHNTIIPHHVLSLDDVRERAQRHRLEVAYLGAEVVGCSTVRPPTDEVRAATVIARVLPAFRQQGFGRELYARGLAFARALGATTIETVVLASNPDGLRFAETRGFVEIDRYVLPGDTVAYIDLRLTA